MKSLKKIRILSRKSDLALIQARSVGSKLIEKFSNVDIEYISKKTVGDIDLKTPLSQMGSAGVFTDDLRNDLLANQCDIAVHSWKDLPLELGPNTILAGSLKRDDQRDIMFIKKNKIDKINQDKILTVLSSSPRRIYNLKTFIKNYLPFKLNKIIFRNIRGNIPSRFTKFLQDDDSDAIIMAKAAIDRLLDNNMNEFNSIAQVMKDNIDQCLWTITPLSQNPTSPGQGALGIEVKRENQELIKMIEDISDRETIQCVNQEREVLKQYGGGCHQKIGVSYVPSHFGLIQIKKGETDDGKQFYAFEKINDKKNFNLKINEKQIYPKSLKEHKLFNRKYIQGSEKEINNLLNCCIWVSRSLALPPNAKINSQNIVWSSGLKTWKSLIQKGIWVNGTSDGMGENLDTNIETLTKNPWIKLTHSGASETKIKKTIYTYSLEKLPIAEDLSTKNFFYWMSSSSFDYALEKFPKIIDGYHACGPGNTYEHIKKKIIDQGRLEVVLSYEAWKKKLL